MKTQAAGAKEPQMKVTQIFRSSKDERVISELTIGAADLQRS
jgi:hypothetical protein